MAHIEQVADDMEGTDLSSVGPDQEESVTPLELFFDLVFVFSITQVTQYIADDPTWKGLVRGLMILAVVWWAWVAYSWLTNTLNTEEDRTRIVLFIAMAAMFVSALAIPHAFNDDALLFAIPYAIVRGAHILLYGSPRSEMGVRQAVARLAPWAATGSALLISAAFLDGTAQGLVWALAILIDFSGPVIGGMRGWTLDAGHFAERHGLVIIIAFGESIVATGLGAKETTLTAPVVAAAVFSIAIAVTLWWLYFDVVSLVAERHLREAKGVEQVRMARDSYSYIHLIMISGIVLLALGAKKTLGDVHEPLKLVPAVALCGGVALYLLGHIAFRLRNLHSVNKQRLLTAILVAALIPLAVEIDALITLGIVAGLLGALISFEALRFGEARARIRRAVHA